MTDDLVAFLKTCVDAEEAAAQDWERAPHTVDCGVRLGYWAERDCVCGYPKRVLAEVAAKRRIIDLHHSLGPSAGTEDKLVCDACGPEEDISFRVETYGRGWPCTTLRLLASVYAGRPGWQSEWAPDEEENRG